MKRILAISLALVAIAAPARGISVIPQTEDLLYRQAVEEARSGRTGPALEILRSLIERLPDRQDILGDYMVVLGWAGDYTAAIQLLDRIDLKTAPPYVIEGLAGSARHLQQFPLAESLYRRAIASAADRVEPEIGLALTLAGADRIDEAASIMTRLRSQVPERTNVLEAYAEIATARQDYFGALAAYQNILLQEPAHRGALRGKVLSIARLGAPELAIEIADRNPGVIDPHDYETLRANSTAGHIRWGTVAADSGRGMERFAALDRALSESDAAGARALDPTAELSAAERILALDRIAALRERFRMRETTAVYEAMAGRKASLPAYVKASAASAYLYLEQPKRARDLYREALADDPGNLETRFGLFYALVESEDHAAALAQIDQIVATTPSSIDAWSPATIRENPAYARVLTARAAAPLFANRPGEAEQRLRELSRRAPFNMGIRTTLASSMRARGWPVAAERELRWILAVEPGNSEALGERAGALLEMREYRAARPALAAVQALIAENKLVIREERSAAVHNLRELTVEVNGTLGSANGGPTGTKDYAVESWLYSSPIAYQYRVFGHFYNAEARFSNGTGRRERAGAGLEYRSRLVAATGEFSRGINESGPGARGGAALSFAFTPNDYWTFRTRFDSSANEIPLQARLAGVGASSGLLDVTWSAHESRGAAFAIEHLAYSDGNRRTGLQVRWTERVLSGPVYKLEVTPALYASRNSLAEAPYFNPASDFSPTLEFANEWVQWRRYERSFRHRLILIAGSYYQKGFGSHPLAGARYEQQWDASSRLVFRYGVERSLHPYDGAQSTSTSAYLSLNWRF